MVHSVFLPEIPPRLEILEFDGLSPREGDITAYTVQPYFTVLGGH